MADEIVKCDKILNEDESVKQYDFSYRVEDGARVNQFCVTVQADEMDDPTDAAEAKTIANTKAASIKTAWMAEEETSAEDVASVVGSVTL